MLVSIIIPVFNEETSVLEVVSRTLSVELPAGVGREIIVVDDGSTDGTAAVLKAFQDSTVVKVHYSVLNFGKGVAVRVGLRYAQGDIILIQDADLEYDPAQISALIQPLLDGQAQVVFGSRYLGKPEGMVTLQNLGNRILTGAVNVLYGVRITDAYTCYKVMTRRVLDKLVLNSKGFELEAELTARFIKLGYKILELPIAYRARSRQEGKKIRARDGFVGLAWLAYYRFFK